MATATWRFLFYCALISISFASLTPLPDGVVVPPGSDVVTHFAMFATTALLALPAFAGATRRRWFGVLLLFAGGLEALQGFVPNRVPDFFDMVANLSGVAVVVLCSWWLGRW